MTGLRPGELEPLKAGVHQALGTLAGVCAAYNLTAYMFRRQPHLLVNGFLYALLTAVEHEQVKHHRTRT